MGSMEQVLDEPTPADRAAGEAQWDDHEGLERLKAQQPAEKGPPSW